MKFEVEEKLLQAIGNYLLGRPYNEVFQLIRGIEALKETNDGRKTDGKTGVEAGKECSGTKGAGKKTIKEK